MLPQSVDSNRYSSPDGILDGIVDQKNPGFSNGSALQVDPVRIDPNPNLI
jgi:hypothetical protein